MATGTINIYDLPDGGEIRQTDVFPALRVDGLVYKVREATGTIVLFAFEDLNKGDALTILSDGSIARAFANSITLTNVIGFAADDVITGDEVPLCNLYAEIPAYPLIVSYRYYLSDVTPGVLVTMPPTTPGNYVVPVGTAVTTTTLLININSPQLIT